MKRPNVAAVRFAQTVYLNALKQAKRDVRQARDEWNSACMNELKKARSREEAIALFKAAPWGESSKFGALARWVYRCTTLKELEEAGRAVSRRMSGRGGGNLIRRRVECVVSDQLRNAKTPEDVIAFLGTIPYCGTILDKNDWTRVADRGRDRLLALCKTTDELERVRGLWISIHGLYSVTGEWLVAGAEYRLRFRELSLKEGQLKVSAPTT